MIGSALVVCTGNICRSPIGERLLSRLCPGLRVSSAGLRAVVGSAADATAIAVAACLLELDLSGHSARSFTAEMGQQNDLILVMDHHHRAELVRGWPQFSGRVMLFDHWVGGKGIDDPYRRPSEFHAIVVDDIHRAALSWAPRLSQKAQS